MPLLVRSIESGSSVRRKFPFVRRAVNSSQNQAVKAMEDTIDRETGIIMK